MNKTIKRLFAFFTIALITFNVIFAQNTNSNATGKGKIVIRSKCNVITNDENVTTDVLARICNELKCDVSDIMEFIPD